LLKGGSWGEGKDMLGKGKPENRSAAKPHRTSHCPQKIKKVPKKGGVPKNGNWKNEYMMGLRKEK